MKLTKKIAFILPKLGRGGAEQVVAQLANRFSERNGDALCICFEELGLLGENLKDKQFNLVCINSHHSYDVLAVIRLAKVLRLFAPDVISIHSYSVLPYVVLALFFCKKKCPLVFTAHGLLYSGFEARRSLYRKFSRYINKITAVSNQVAIRHKEYLYWENPIEIIENGSKKIIFNHIDGLKLRTEFLIPKDCFVFITVGNIRPEKGIEDLLEAIFVLKKNSEKIIFKVLIVGASQDNIYYEKMRKLSFDLNIDENIIFVGHRTDISSVYSCANSFILPSRSEGLPMVVLEAMSCKLPVIATKVGGVPQVLQNEAGILVEIQSPENLANAMLIVMENSELRTKIGSRGYDRFIENYSVDKMLDGYLCLFNELINK